MNKKVIKKAALSFLILGLVSCGNSGNDEHDADEHQIVVKDTIPSVEDTDNGKPMTDHGVPTPNEFFEVIRLNGGALKGDLVNKLENRNNYIDQESKALNFGVYSADLAYMSCFGIGTEFLKYFKAIEELGEELGISGAFNQDLMERIESNEGDTDSLFSISNETYYDSYLYLEENGKGAELSLIMAGGYIESLFIVCNVLDTYDENNPIIQKIGDQKLVLENLLAFVEVYIDDQKVANAYGNLADLNDIFEKEMELTSDGTNVETNDGTLMLSGGGNFNMNEAAFEAIKIKVTELRNNITNK